MLNVKWIEDKLKEKGWSEAEFGRQIDMTRQYIGIILHYQKSCSLKVLARIADVLGCSLDDLWLK